MIYRLKNLSDLLNVKYSKSEYSSIEVDLTNFLNSGLLRHIIKYSFHGVKVGGFLKFICPPFRSLEFSSKYIDFWQVRHEIFKCLTKYVDIRYIDEVNGIIELVKAIEYVSHDGVSFGIVFSGSVSEEIQLIKSIFSIITINNLEKFNYEIIVCGPHNYNPIKILEIFKDYNLKYLVYNLNQPSYRLMITQKKNFLYQNFKYSISTVNHTRILYASDFVNKLYKRSFDVITPRIIYKKNNKDYDYLDYCLIGSYDLSKLNPRRSLSRFWIQNTLYLNLLKNRVAYIDGGITVFNKNIIPYSPYNNNLSWGEAEDVEMCARLYYSGVLIDYFDDIICFSSTNKISLKPHFIYEVFKFITKFFFKIKLNIRNFI